MSSDIGIARKLIRTLLASGYDPQGYSAVVACRVRASAHVARIETPLTGTLGIVPTAAAKTVNPACLARTKSAF